MNWPQNPFPFGTPVPSGDLFINRDRELERLRESVKNPQMTVVLVEGARRIGKTSILQHFRREVEADAAPVALDVQDLSIAHSEIPAAYDVAVREVLLALGKSLLIRVGVEGGTGTVETVRQFQEDFLLPALRLSGPKRIVVLLDEFDILEDRYPAAIEEVLAAFRIDFDPPPLLVCCCGRPMGAPKTDRLAYLLKAAMPVVLKPFNEVMTKAAPDLAGVYAFTDSARALFWDVTQGHPLWVNAINHYIYSERSRLGDASAVDAEEVLLSLEPACELFKHAIWNAWRQLGPMQSLLCRAAADVTWDGQQRRFFGTATPSQIESELQSFFAEITADQFRRAADALVDNYVLRAEGEGYRLYSPFLGYWLRQQDKIELRLTGDPQAAQHITQAREALARNDAAGALLAVNDAVALDPTNTDALLIAAQMAGKEGNLDTAIWWLEQADRRQPQAARLRLSEVLTQRIGAASRRGNSPDPWYHKLREVAPEEAESDAVVRSVLNYHLGRWEQFIRRGEGETAHAVFDELSNHPVFDELSNKLPARYRVVAERYANLVRSLIRAEDGLARCVLVVGREFLTLTEKEIEPAAPMETDFERGLVSQFDGQSLAQEMIRQYFEQYADNAPWWTSTLAVIEQSLKLAEVGKPEWLSLSVLEDITRRAPDPHRGKLRDAVKALLPQRLGEILRADLLEGANAVRLLFEAQPAPAEDAHLALQDALETHVMQVITEADDEEVVRFFRDGARAYLQWVEFVAPGGRQCDSILEQIGLLMGRMREPRGPTPPDSRKWELFIRGGEGLPDWQGLLRHKALKGALAEKQWEELRPTEEVARAIRAASLGQPRNWNLAVKSSLDYYYQNVRQLPVGIPGIPAEVVKFYRAHWNGEEVNLKVYRLSAPRTPSTKEFLTHLWEKEKRALVNLSTRLSGRALTRFKYSERIKDDEGGEYLVIVTEPAGPTTLREELTNFGRGGILTPERRPELWYAIHSLVESVSALHSAHYLHRSIRPENIFVQKNEGKPQFKLGNFEWSLYLHSMADEFPKERGRWVDWYTAPEVLSARFDGKSDVGEGFSSEVYSLGLVMFELLVRRLNDTEMVRLYGTGSNYDQKAHEKWLHGLRKEVRGELSRHDQKDERLLLLEMLEPNVALRRSDLDDLVRLTASFAWDSREIEALLNEHKPYVAVALARGGAESIKRALRPLVRAEKLAGTERDLSRLIGQEIAGARVYRNANRDRPLLIEGRRVSFAASPLEYYVGRRMQEPEMVSEVPYLSVANDTLDRKDGPPLAKLPDDLPVLDYYAANDDLKGRQREVVRRGKAWGLLFALARAGVDLLPDESREFYTILQITAEVEEKLWRQQVAPYRLVSTDREAGRLVIVVRQREGTTGHLPLDRMVAQQATRGEHFFELSAYDSPLAELMPNQVWKLERVNTAQGTVQLSRESGGWPIAEGHMRPQSLSGNRAISRRRAEALLNLRDDEYLLRAVTNVSAIQEKRPAGEMEYLDPSLDDDKRSIVRNILTTPPLYLVQGPPGTGKTTLAAEIIRQVLAENPSARILVTSQSHEPLNNLLMRVNQAFKNVDEVRKPAAVRLLSSSLLQSRRWSEETRQVMMEFQPAEVAKRYLDSARSWQPSGDSGIDAGLVRKWRAWLETHSKNLPSELERKIVASANLVYATANDRSIASVPEHREFDLLIFEEAAKAYPLEVLGPMRLARRWLLIGDHEQLSAFNIDEFRREASISALRLYEEAGGQVPGGQRQTRALGLGERSRYVASEVADFFQYLFTKGTGERVGQRFAERLSLQWRMHPKISHMVRDVYYKFLQDGDVDTLKQKHAHRISYPEDFRRNALIWVDVPLTAGRHSRGPMDADLAAEEPFSGGGYRNSFEARVLFNVMKSIQVSGRGGLAGNIAFLSPYKAQVDLINSFFKSWDRKSNPQTGDLRQRAYTVDSFQGRQAEVVAVSLVRNNTASGEFDAYGFLYGDVGRARSAVMFSRAERLLVVIGCSEHFCKERSFHIGKVYDFIRQHGLVIDAKQFLKGWDYAELRKHREARERRAARRLSRQQ